HLLLHGVPLKVIQAYLGHSRVSSTEIYTRIFTLDLNWLGSVRFSQ
ncbi:TPA: phage integrase family protein, partial [Klebsiella pneumoniae]|nr:phage integrase family protein [Klebsiella pneumoniae]